MNLLPLLVSLALAAADPATEGDGAVAPAGSQAAAVSLADGWSGWRGSLATGVTGKLGGMRLEGDERNSRVLLYFGAQAHGTLGERGRRAARVRLRLFTGGEGSIYAPSEGDAEAAYTFGDPALRFVVGRLELARYPTLAIEALAQVSTLPCFEGVIPLGAGDMRFHYFLSPVEGAWVHYYGGAHVPRRPGWTSESDRPSAATAARLRYSATLPADLVLSLQGEFMKMWRRADLLVAAEGSLGFPVLRRSAMLSVLVRWSGYTRRSVVPDRSDSEADLVMLAVANVEL